MLLQKRKHNVSLSLAVEGDNDAHPHSSSSRSDKSMPRSPLSTKATKLINFFTKAVVGEDLFIYEKEDELSHRINVKPKQDLNDPSSLREVFHSMLLRMDARIKSPPQNMTTNSHVMPLDEIFRLDDYNFGCNESYDYVKDATRKKITSFFQNSFNRNNEDRKQIAKQMVKEIIDETVETMKNDHTIFEKLFISFKQGEAKNDEQICKMLTEDFGECIRLMNKRMVLKEAIHFLGNPDLFKGSSEIF